MSRIALNGKRVKLKKLLEIRAWRSQQPGNLIEAADATLYAAKHRGHNAVAEHGFVRVTDEDGMALAS
jgi:GGDEF domain-containing protein